MVFFGRRARFEVRGDVAERVGFVVGQKPEPEKPAVADVSAVKTADDWFVYEVKKWVEAARDPARRLKIDGLEDRTLRMACWEEYGHQMRAN